MSVVCDPGLDGGSGAGGEDSVQDIIETTDEFGIWIID